MHSIGLIGIALALALMTYGVYKNWSILYLSVFSAAIIALFNRISITTALTKDFILGFSAFAAPNFILFIEGAIFGKLFDDSGAAWRLGKTIVDKAGKSYALLGYLIITFILELGGISTFVICFVLLPIARPIWRETNTPWYLFPAYTIMAIIPSELMMPGGLQIHNIIPTNILGTTTMAAPLMGVVMTVVYFILCSLYLKYETKRAMAVEWKRNSLPPVVAEKDSGELDRTAPGVLASVLPIIIALVLINFLGVLPIYGLGAAIITGALMFRKSIADMLGCLNHGATNGVLPLVLVATVVGIARVVASTPAFDMVRESLVTMGTGSGMGAAFTVVGVTNIVALITGSASGAISMTLEMFSEMWMAAGLSPEWIHRTVVTAAGGFDTVPWNSFVILLLSLSGLDHKRAYMPVFWVSLVGPIVVALLSAFFV